MKMIPDRTVEPLPWHTAEHEERLFKSIMIDYNLEEGNELAIDEVKEIFYEGLKIGREEGQLIAKEEHDRERLGAIDDKEEDEIDALRNKKLWEFSAFLRDFYGVSPCVNLYIHKDGYFKKYGVESHVAICCKRPHQIVTDLAQKVINAYSAPIMDSHIKVAKIKLKAHHNYDKKD